MSKKTIKVLTLDLLLLWAANLFMITMISVHTGYASNILIMMQGLYMGYDVPLIGNVAGLIYGYALVYLSCLLFIRISKQVLADKKPHKLLQEYNMKTKYYFSKYIKIV